MYFINVMYQINSQGKTLKIYKRYSNILLGEVNKILFYILLIK